MKGKRLMTAAFTLLMGMAASAQEGLLKETIAYRDTFKMDVYVNPSVKVDGKRPVFIHTHGGGWNSGDRNINAQTGVWADMLREGMVVVSIDYRQGVAMARAEGKLKDMPVVSADSKEAFDGEEVSPIIRQSILWGVEDLYDATTYVLQHADRWNADPECVILGGGSAGAIESLTAEYLQKNADPLALTHLPQGFQFAGVIAAAGAIWVDGGDVPVWQQKPCPMMFFHGSADRTVYPHLLHIDALNSSFSGPEIIIPTLRDQQVSYMYYVGEGYDHVMSGIPFETYGKDMMTFIHRVIYNKEKVAVKTIEEDYEGPRNLVRYYTELMGISKEEFLKRVQELNTKD